ncbi:MAG: response regulator [Deltaproteobacteria bacterium]|nr:response regulator [Deltaproteobacteria bacterium]MBW2153594.1 response regulator [Deltaproteobacteria bacterium]
MKDTEKEKLLKERRELRARVAELEKIIKEQRWPNEAARESERNFSDIIHASPMGAHMYRLEDDGRLVFIGSNPAAEKILGVDHSQFIGKTIEEAFPPIVDTEVPERYRMAASEGVIWHTEQVNYENGPIKGIFEVHAFQISPGKMAAMFLDITERRQAEEERSRLQALLNHAQKMEAVGTLAGGVAHDFNNILTTIIGNAELAMMALENNSSVYGNIKEILKAGQHAAALTRQLLAFSRKDMIQPRVLNLNVLIMNLEKMLRRLIGENIELITTYESDLWKVEVDSGQMEQVIINLSVNARDAMPKRGKLYIETGNVEHNEAYFKEHAMESEPGPYVMIAITDTGTGMDKETQSRIFEPFFTTKELGRGTGLGLSTVYGIVKQNKGHIWVYSEEGKGTTFKVYLPKTEAETKDVVQEQSELYSLRGQETVLVVEDDERLLSMIKTMLEVYGYRVLTAKDGGEALEISTSYHGPIHLLLTDVVMPGMSGSDLADQLKSKLLGIKVLYMSGYTDNIIARHGVIEKDAEFLEKPFTKEALVGKVRKVLDKKPD